MNYREEFLVSAAGPGLNLLLAYLLCTIPDCVSFAGVNLTLALFNLLPVRELDGARMLRCLLINIMPEKWALLVCGCVSFSFTAMFALLGFYLAVQNGNLTMLLMSFWMLKPPVGEKTLL